MPVEFYERVTQEEIVPLLETVFADWVVGLVGVLIVAFLVALTGSHILILVRLGRIEQRLDYGDRDIHGLREAKEAHKNWISRLWFEMFGEPPSKDTGPIPAKPVSKPKVKPQRPDARTT